jgi:glycosyltransferase involved in cell wall biosynthesis
VTRTVLHYSDSSVLGGTERALLQLLEGLDRSRWRPVLLHHPSPGIEPMLAEARALGVETISVPRGTGAWTPGAWRAIARAIRDVAPEVVHAHQSWPLSCEHGIVAAGLARIPAVLATLQLFVDLPQRPGIAIRFRTLRSVVDRFICVSQHVANSLRQRFGVGPAKIAIVRNAIALDPPGLERDARRATLRRQLDVGDAPLVLSVARLESEKGLSTLLDAAVAVPSAIFLVAGEGSEREVLERRARQLELGNRFRLLGYRDDVRDLLVAADLFVLASSNEGFPLSVLEAMATRTPVIATAIGGTDEVVRDGQTGLLVPPGDPEALASAIGRLVADRSLAGRLRDTARRHIEAEHTLAAMIAGVQDEYEAVLRRHDPVDVA